MAGGAPLGARAAPVPPTRSAASRLAPRRAGAPPPRPAPSARAHGRPRLAAAATRGCGLFATTVGSTAGLDAASLRRPPGAAPAPSPLAGSPAPRASVGRLSFACRVVAGKKGKPRTCKTAAKRFKVTGSGKVVYVKPGTYHLNSKMTNAHRRRARGTKLVTNSYLRHLRGLMPYAGIVKPSRNGSKPRPHVTALGPRGPGGRRVVVMPEAATP